MIKRNNGIKIGIIGCGYIAKTYATFLQQYEPDIFLSACADINMQRAHEFGIEFGIKSLQVTELLKRDDITAILNLTTPNAHTKVSLEILENNKHLYSEKPLALNTLDGKKISEKASEKNLLVGVAPDTFLGAGQQACRMLIDRGDIGQPLSAIAFMMIRGVEHWHPNPQFYYQKGGGPLFDMGSYYLTSLINLFGPVKGVMSLSKKGFETRKVQSSNSFTQIIPVEVNTHYTSMLEFNNGVHVSMIMSFDVVEHSLPHIEVYGTKGTISVPNPDCFGGEVSIRYLDSDMWLPIPTDSFDYHENSRGIGLVDLLNALKERRSPRTSMNLAFHILEVMEAIDYASHDHEYHLIKSHCTRPLPLPRNKRNAYQ